jgi:hypothetical protein
MKRRLLFEEKISESGSVNGFIQRAIRETMERDESEGEG